MMRVMLVLAVLFVGGCAVEGEGVDTFAAEVETPGGDVGGEVEADTGDAEAQKPVVRASCQAACNRTRSETNDACGWQSTEACTGASYDRWLQCMAFCDTFFPPWDRNRL